MVPLAHSEAFINAAKRNLPQEEVLLSKEHILQASLAFPQEETQSSPVDTPGEFFAIDYLDNIRTKKKKKEVVTLSQFSSISIPPHSEKLIVQPSLSDTTER